MWSLVPVDNNTVIINKIENKKGIDSKEDLSLKFNLEFYNLNYSCLVALLVSAEGILLAWHLLTAA